MLFLQNVSAQENMLCRGHYWTEDEANLVMKEFAENWHDQPSWETRAETIRLGIIEGLQISKMSDIEGNFNPLISEPVKINGYMETNGYIVENIAIESFPGFYITGNLYRPTTKQENYPAILSPHGHWFDRRFSEEVQIRCASLARMGAIDDRIKVAVPAVQVSAHFFGRCSCESGMRIHKSKDHQTNNVEIAALFAPKPMLRISNGADYTRNTPQIEYPYIQKVYALYDAEHKVENVHFPNQKHDFGYDKRVVAYNFFGHHLDLNVNRMPYNNGFKEDFIILGYRNDLSIFNVNNPIPENALQGDDEVIAFLKSNYGILYDIE